MKRSGFADLPLQGGRVPPWLAERMTKLGAAISESILLHYGAPELLSRLSDPFWFQALGSVMGMDWHSSGITTSVLGALKRGLNPRAHELGIYICGGRGRHSRNTPDELRAVAERRGLARRYHWHSAAVRDFTSSPHTAIVGEPVGQIMNLVDSHAVPAQDAIRRLPVNTRTRRSTRRGGSRCPDIMTFERKTWI